MSGINKIQIKSEKIVTTRQLKKMFGASKVSYFIRNSRIGYYHFRTPKYDVHHIGHGEWIVEPKRKLNDELFE